MPRIDWSTVDLNLLVVLDRLLARESVSAAATDLGLSQPAISRSLQRLRDQLGDPLLVRVGRDMVPTPVARELAEPVAQALAAVGRVFSPRAPFDPATATGELVVGMGDEAQVALLDAIAAAVWAAAPGVDLRIRTLSGPSVDDARRGRIDLAIAPDLAALPASAGAVDLSEFVHREVYRRRFAVVAAPGRPPLDLEAWLAAKHVILSFEGGRRGFVDDLLAERGLTRRVAASVTTFVAAARLAGSTDLVATMPREVALAAGVDLALHEPPIPLPDLPMLVLWHPTRTTDARHRFLRERVIDAIRARAATWA